VLSGITVQNAEEGARGDKKRCKQHLQGVAAVADSDGGDNKEADSSGVARVVTAAGNSKRLAWPPTDHFERLLEEVCPNHTYPIKHKLRDCGMMKNFYDGCSTPSVQPKSKDPNSLQLGTRGREDVGAQIFQYPYISIYIYMNTYIIATLKAKKKTTGRIA
jgi:hypothetical protein